MPPEAIVIGAGPAGLMAAEVMASAGLAVTVHEKMPSPARKFLMAGRGGLNLTHSEPMDKFMCRYAQAASWLAKPVDNFTPSDLRKWVDDLGEDTFVGSSGRVFPKSFKASPLVRAWLHRLDGLGVKLVTRSQWAGWDDLGLLRFSDGSTSKTDITVLALGGASWPRLGADGSWSDVLAAKDITVEPLVASNAGVMCDLSDITRQRHAGFPLKRIALTCGDETVRGEAMISGTGLEGGAVYALSRHVRNALKDGHCELHIDLMPDMTADELAHRLSRVPRKQSLSNRLRKGAKLDPAKIAILRDFTPEMPDTDEALARTIKQVVVQITGTQPLDRAISSAGGIAMSEVDEKFMLKKLPGTFVCGEMLDWDAPTGGYLLQACLATGAAAGQGALDYVRKTA